MQTSKSDRTKYNVSKATEPRTADDIVFDSALEMRYYCDVILPGVLSGDIAHWERQKVYELQPKFKWRGKTIRPVNYVADFYIERADGTSLVVDTKGNPDAVALLKRKMFHYKYPDVNYIWLSYSKIDGGWIEFEELKRKRKQRKASKRNGGWNE